MTSTDYQLLAGFIIACCALGWAMWDDHKEKTDLKSSVRLYRDQALEKNPAGIKERLQAHIDANRNKTQKRDDLGRFAK